MENLGMVHTHKFKNEKDQPIVSLKININGIPHWVGFVTDDNNKTVSIVASLSLDRISGAFPLITMTYGAYALFTYQCDQVMELKKSIAKTAVSDMQSGINESEAN